MGKTIDFSNLIDISDIYNSDIEQQFQKFADAYNNCETSAEVLANQLGYDLNDAIVKYAKTQDNGTLSLKGFTESLKEGSIKGKLLKLTLKGLSIAGSVAAEFLISEFASAIYECAQANEKLKESAQALGDEFSSTKSDIDDYKSEIEDLYTTINDSSSSYQDVKEAREQLLLIQDEMIEKFGTEKESIELVTQAINGQTKALGELAEQEYRESMNEFNADNSISSIWANWWSGSANNEERMIKQMEDTEISFSVANGSKEFIQQLEEIYGLEGLQRRNGNVSFTLTGNLEEIYDKLLDIQQLADDMNVSSLATNLSNVLTDTKDTIDSYETFYNQHILYDTILKDDNYEEYYNDINEAYEKYSDAFTSGNEEAISNAIQNFSEIIQNATENIDDDSVIAYFKNMYSDLQAEVGTWKFEVKFNAESDGENELVKSIEKYVSEFQSADDILNYTAKTATQEQIVAYNNLEKIATDYDLAIDELIEKLKELGIIQSQTSIDAQNKVESLFSIDFVGETIQDALWAKTNNAQKSLVENWVSNLSDEDKDIFNSTQYDKALQKIKESTDNTTLSLEDYKKALESVKEVENSTSNNYSSFSDVWNSDDFVDAKEELLELAQSGKLTAEEIESNEDYSTLLTETGLSAENAKAEILSLLSATEKLSAASQGIESLEEAYKEFQEDGFVYAETLTSLPDSLKNLPEYDVFEEIVGDPTSGAEAIQNAFNDIVTAYFYSQDTLMGLLDASESEVQSYIANLTEMGVTNANEVVNSAITSINAIKNQTSEELQFVEQAESEYLKLYQEVLEGKADASLDYLETEQSNNYRLVEALGETYKSDYDNWVDLLTQKAEAYNEWVDAIATANSLTENSSIPRNSSNAVGEKIVSDAYNQYAEITSEANSLKEKLSFELSKVDISFSNYSPDVSSSSDSSSSETEEVFDFIEIKISRLEDKISSLKETATNAYKSLTTRQKAYTNAISATSEEIDLQKQAYNAYIAKANSIGLSEDWAKQVRDGSLNIETVTDETLKDQIDDYQTWYEKAKDCLDTVEDLETELTELKIEKIQLEIDVKADALDKLESKLDRLEGKVSLKEAWGFTASTSDYKKMNENLIKQISNLNSQNDLLKQQQKLVKKGSEAWNDYQKSIDDNSTSIQSLTQSIAENAEAAASLANEKAEAKVEKIDSSDELYSAKATNASTSYKKQNSYINKEIKNIAKRQTAYDNAVSTNLSNVKSSISSINKTKKTKENKSLLKEIKKYTKSKKEIPQSLLNKASKLNDSGALHNKLVQYNKYLEAYETSKDTAELYEETAKQEKAELAAEKISNIETYYSNRQHEYSQKATQINSAMSLAEAQGYADSTLYYDKLIEQEKKNNSSLSKEREELIASLESSMKSGDIEAYSSEWYELCQQIDEVTNSINDSTLALQEYENQIRQIEWDRFDSLQEAISNVASEIDFLVSELSREDLTTSDIGWLTDEGKAVATLYASSYEIYTKQAQNYAQAIADLNAEYADDQYNTDYLERKNELVSAYQSAITAAQDEKYAILDLYENGYNALLDKLGELIDEYEDLLDSEKSAYDYSEKISDSVKNISSLRKQMDAYAGDTSEETRAKLQSLTVDLAEAEQDLQDSQYEQMISVTKDMLSDMEDSMTDAVQDIIDSLSKNFDSLLSKIDSTSTSAMSVIDEKMTGIGYTPTSEVVTLFTKDGGILSNTNDALASIAETQTAINNSADATSMRSMLSTIANAYTTAQQVNEEIQSEGSAQLSNDLASASANYTAKETEVATLTASQTAAYNNLTANDTELQAAATALNTAQTEATKHPKSKKKQQALTDAQNAYNIALANYNSAEATYNGISSQLSTAQASLNEANQLLNAMNYLSTHLDTTTTSRGDLSEINQALYDQYGQRVLTTNEMKELASLLGVTYDNQSSTGTLYTALKSLGVNGFKVGSSNILKDQLALLAEEGTELQFDSSEGVLKEVGQGDKIFTNEMSENLWKLAKDYPSNLMNNNSLIPTQYPVLSSIQTGSQTITIGDIVLPDVTNPEQFANALKDTIKNNSSVKNLLKDTTVGSLSKSSNSLSIRKY